METITVKSFTASKVSVEVTDPIMLDEIYEFFKFKDPKRKINPFSKKKWDGKDRMFDKRRQLLPRGLVSLLFEFAKNASYKFKMDKGVITRADLTMDDLVEYVEGLNIKGVKEGKQFDITPYDYQYYGVLQAIKNQSTVLLADTNAGKTLMLYMLARFALDITDYQARILILCPSVMLVNQMYDDFESYSAADDNFNMACVHTIKAGANKYRRSPIVISTWQSLQNEDPEFFQPFTHVMTDEVHGASAEKLTYIMNSLINCYFRTGVTGSLRESELHIMKVQALFGQIIRVVTTQMLEERGQSVKTHVRMVQLNYSSSENKLINKLDWLGKIEYIVNHRGRNRFIAESVNRMKGNTLVMFDRKQHAQNVYEAMKALGMENVYILNGDVPEAERERIKRIADTDDGVTLLGSFSMISTGVSIRKLHNLVIGSTKDSNVTVLQTIGRMLRTHSTKDIANIIDMVDRFSKSNESTFVKHALHRYKIYTSKGHEVSMHNVPFGKQVGVDPKEYERMLLESNVRIAAAEARAEAFKDQE